MKKITKLFYHEKYFALFHWSAGFVFRVLICTIIYVSKIIPLEKLTSLISMDVISLSATIAGFELAGVTLLISLNEDRKFQSIKDISSDKTIYKLFFHSIILLTVSLVTMLIDISLLNNIAQGYLKVKGVIEYVAIVLFVQGLMFLLSALRMLVLIFK